jgi:NTP pyrophosphatase (non-canonical NTP hydrolase)
MKVRRLYLGTLLTLTVGISLIYPTVAFPLQYHLLSIGSVELKRSNWLWYRRINAPESLNPNDLIRVTQRNSAKIRCSDWREKVVPTGSTRVSDICPSVNRPRLRHRGSNIIAPRGGKNLLIPFLITPRRTAILEDKPLLSWNAVPNATRYKVRLRGSSGIIWETEVSHNQVIYPGEPPLEQGERYSIVVEANTGTSSLAEGIPKLGFSLLEENEAQELKYAARQLAEAELPDETKALELAHLYRSYNLMAEAIEVLEALVDQGKSTTAVYELLGDCYWQIGLTLHARDAYSQVVELAVNPEEIEDKAKAQRALGEIYITLKQFEQAVSLLKDARMAYVELEGYNSEKVSEIDGRLAELDLSVKMQ